MAMIAQIDEKSRKLVITLDLMPEPKPSESGKTLVIATTHGNQATTLNVSGKPVFIGVSAFFKPDK